MRGNLALHSDYLALPAKLSDAVVWELHKLKVLTSITDVHDATITVKPENLHKIDLHKAHQQLPQLLQRIRRLRKVGFLDRGAHNVLEDLGKYTDLTSVEEGLLS